MSVVNLQEEQVKELLDWPLVCNAVEQALLSVCKERMSDSQPSSIQPVRPTIQIEKGTNQNIVRHKHEYRQSYPN